METRLLSFLQNSHYNCWVAAHAVLVCVRLWLIDASPLSLRLPFRAVLESVTYPLGAKTLRAN